MCINIVIIIIIIIILSICMGGGEPATARGQLRQACAPERRRASNGTRPSAASLHTRGKTVEETVGHEPLRERTLRRNLVGTSALTETVWKDRRARTLAGTHPSAQSIRHIRHIYDKGAGEPTTALGQLRQGNTPIIIM